MDPRDQARQVGVASSWIAQVPVWGDINNPIAAQVICDTGALPVGWYDVFYCFSAAAAGGYYSLGFEHRNAANTSTLWIDMLITAAAGSARNAFYNIYVANDERFRIESPGGFSGRCMGAIYAVRRA